MGGSFDFEDNEMTWPDIRSLIPHSDAMVLVDRVIAVDEESLCAEVRIRPDSLFCMANGVGAWIGLEYMAQTIAAFAGYTAYAARRTRQARVFTRNKTLRMYPDDVHPGQLATSSCPARVAERKWFRLI